MLQESLSLAWKSPVVLDLACTPHPSPLNPGASLPLWPPGSHMQKDPSGICCLVMGDGIGFAELFLSWQSFNLSPLGRLPCRVLPGLGLAFSVPTGTWVFSFSLLVIKRVLAISHPPAGGEKEGGKLHCTPNLPSSYYLTLYFKYLCYIIGSLATLG